MNIKKIRFLSKTWAVVPILITLLGASYKLGYDISKERLGHLEKLVQEYRESSNLNTAETIASLKQAADRFNFSKSERDRFDSVSVYSSECGSRGKQSEERIKLLGDTLKIFRDSASLLYSALKTLSDELRKCAVNAKPFTLREGQAADVVKNKVSIGVSRIYSTHALINVNNQQKTMQPGNTLRFFQNSYNCRLTVMGIVKSREVKVSCNCERIFLSNAGR